MVLPVADFKVSRSLRKTLRRFITTPGCELRFDSAFDRVIEACAGAQREGQSGTWIVPEMMDAYRAWHRLGRSHSAEVWIDGDLVGGLYFISIGRMVFGESMFSRRNDASKIALAGLVCACRARGVPLIDCQQNTGHLASLGAHEISRGHFQQHLAAVLTQPDVADWTYDESLWALLDGLAAPDRDDPS
jgi:leucyl/phenylalanyl-tRNA--protein transferase